MPSPNGHNGKSNGRTRDGKFAPGWKGGPGNPHGKATAQLRSALFNAVKEKHILSALATILRVMRKGRDADRLAAARELLDRIIGKPVQQDLLERVEKLEALLAAHEEENEKRKD